MRRCRFAGWLGVAGSLALLAAGGLSGCGSALKRLTDGLARWSIVGDEALEDPLRAVGGDAVFFVPAGEGLPLGRRELAAAEPDVLVHFYAPVYVQQRVDSRALRRPYPPEYDCIGTAHLRREALGKLKSYVAGPPTVYAIFARLCIDGRPHVQITYTAWYPAHPRMKALDLEAADIDSCVLRVTLDADNCPLFYETILACGCFHKVFVERWVEEAARQSFGPPEKDRQYCVERNVKNAIAWEVAGVVDAPREQPRRPVVFLKAGNHRVIGMGCAGRLRVPLTAEKHPYDLTSYADLYTVAIDGTTERAGFFDMDQGGKVRGAERRKEKFFLSFMGVDSAGQPRADDQIKLHFDESTWGDPTIYSKYLRLPAGCL